MYKFPTTSIHMLVILLAFFIALKIFQGYACAWRKLLAPVTSKSGSVTDSTAATTTSAGSSGTTNGGEEMKDLWIFHYSELPDLSASVSSELRGNSITNNYGYFSS